MRKIGGQDIIARYAGSEPVLKRYHGSELVWESVAGYDADYQAVLDYATANSIPLPTEAQQDIDNQLMIDFKNAGYYSKRTVIFKAKGTADPAFKLICWKRKIAMNAYGSLTWDSEGVLPNGTNTYIDPIWNGFNDPDYGLEDAGYDFTSLTMATSGVKSVFGYYSGTTDDYVNLLQRDSNSQASLHSLVLVNHSWMEIGYNAVNRNSGVVDINNGALSINNAAVSKTQNPFMLARNRADNGSVDSYWTDKVGFMSIGKSVLSEFTTIKNLVE